MDIGALGKGKGKQGKGKHGKGKGKGKGKQGQQGRDRRLNVGTVESADTTRKTVGARRTPKKGKHKSKDATDAHNLDSTKPAHVQPVVEIGEFDMGYLDVGTLQQQESEWIKVGVDTGAGKTAWPQSVTHGKKLPGHVDLTFRTATGELVKSGERLHV